MATGQTRVVASAETVTVGDGRELAYAEYGDPEGTPVVFCHGMPGSRVSASVARDRKADLGVRVIAPDRPGVGQSAFAGVRPLADWAEDVATLMDALGVDEYGVAGFSAGAPYALACAAHTPGRVTRCVVASGAPPPAAAHHLDGFTRALTAVSRHSAHLARPLAWLLCRQVTGASRFTDVVGDPRDGDLADPRFGETGRILLSDCRECVRQGAKAVAVDYACHARDWDFDLADVEVPARVVHGDADDAVPLAVAEYVAGELPDAELTVYENAGHYRPIVEHVGDVFGWPAGVDVADEAGDGAAEQPEGAAEAD
jgi:pimeloyl-ACP methyl ester carboxylesterase